jgi:O-acetyl-ADP-ribose deacetylase (regulator of RNase III)
MPTSRDLPHGRIELVVGNIVEQKADAIVNAANTSLAGGGGVDGAIHRAAGKALLEQCLELPQDEQGRRCPTGECRVTGAGKLNAKYVIHAVGPVYNERSRDKSAALLKQVHEQVLRAAAEHGCHSVAFPAISTGAYRFPIEQAAAIALTAVHEFLSQPSSLNLVRFTLFSQSHLDAFTQALEQLDA